MGVTVAVARTTCNVAVGNQDITTDDLGGLVPKAAWFIISRAISDGVAANHAIIGVGAATATDERWSFSMGAEHNANPPNTDRHGMTNECVSIINAGAATIDGEADFVQFFANGCRINWGNAPAAAYYLTVVFFAGTDLTAHAGSFTLGNLNVEVNVNTVGFEPDVLLTATHCMLLNDSGGSSAYLSHGVVTNKDSVTQLCFGNNWRDGQAATEVTGQIRNDYGAIETLAAGTVRWGADFGSFDAQGFSCWSRVGNSNDDIGFLALEFNDAVDFEASIITTPVAVGNQSQNFPGFTPQFVHCGLTNMQTVNTAYTDESAGSLGISTFDEDDEYCNSAQNEDGVLPSDTQSISDDQCVNLPNDDGVARFAATFVSFDDNGWTWNFSATYATHTKSWWALAIEEFVEVIAPTVLPARDLMYIEQVTYREPYGLQLVGGDDERLEVFLAQRGLPAL